jgi:hypothetical protein
MEQKSNVQYRAEKEYKNSREKFFLLLREIISNAVHAVLIRQSKEVDFIPKVDLDITFDDTLCKIELTDNGEGFNEKNRKYFEELDQKNPEKEKHNFHPLGQGRLAIIYFADSAVYETVYKDENGKYNKRTIPYPNETEGVFSFEEFKEEEASNNTYTKLTILINKQQTLGRAKTFFRNYSNSQSFKQWFIETFFPFIITNKLLIINISRNGDNVIIKKDSIESETKQEPFDLRLLDDNQYSFTLWLVKNDEQMRGDNPIVCFARNLIANLSNGKLSYQIDNNEGYHLYLTSDFFDEYVDTKGEKIDISCDEITSIQKKINEILDDRFKVVIENNQKVSKRNLKNFQKKYPSLEAFVAESNIVGDKNIVNEKEIIQSAIDEKSRIEKKFWNQIDRNSIDEEEQFSDSEECHKLLNSSLHIYVKHREIILKRLHALIQKFDEDGANKPELESTVHELFINRGTTLSDSSNINHLHNLWILDDKFTTFSNNFKAESTKSGQSLSDVYIWADDPEKTKQILIFELKSTTKAHNAGSKEEGMIAQVKRYAQDFYKNPTKTLNWDVNTDVVQYTGIILARKSDIDKELTSNNVSGGYHQIPFLEDSYYYDDEFSKDNSPKKKMPIRIELYSFEDIYNLASDRNGVFFKLLKREFEFNEDDD